jgi:hypothetical protein
VDVEKPRGWLNRLIQEGDQLRANQIGSFLGINIGGDVTRNTTMDLILIRQWEDGR